MCGFEDRVGVAIVVDWFSHIDITLAWYRLCCIWCHVRKLFGRFRLVLDWLTGIWVPVLAKIRVEFLALISETTVVAPSIIVVGVAVALIIALSVTVAFVIVARAALVVFVTLVRRIVVFVIVGLGAWSTKEGSRGPFLLQSVAVKCCCVGHLLRRKTFVKFPDHVPVRFRTVRLDMVCCH